MLLAWKQKHSKKQFAVAIRNKWALITYWEFGSEYPLKLLIALASITIRYFNSIFVQSLIKAVAQVFVSPSSWKWVQSVLSPIITTHSRLIKDAKWLRHRARIIFMTLFALNGRKKESFSLPSSSGDSPTSCCYAEDNCGEKSYAVESLYLERENHGEGGLNRFKQNLL